MNKISKTGGNLKTRINRKSIFNNNNIKLIVYDFDGVMTDNRALIFNSGDEAVFINRSDGMAVRMLAESGFTQIILTSETNKIAEYRAQKLGISAVSGVKNKKNALIEIALENQCSLKDILYIGNDINDLEAMQAVGHPMCPADAHQTIKKISEYIFSANGGCGVIRELYDLTRKLQ